ncbi:Uncharacterised protein [Chlamydia abortus]|nr:Uncharacterised protein [Chlamydia abortus]
MSKTSTATSLETFSRSSKIFCSSADTTLKPSMVKSFLPDTERFFLFFKVTVTNNLELSFLSTLTFTNKSYFCSSTPLTLISLLVIDEAILVLFASISSI